MKKLFFSGMLLAATLIFSSNVMAQNGNKKAEPVKQKTEAKAETKSKETQTPKKESKSEEKKTAPVKTEKTTKQTTPTSKTK